MGTRENGNVQGRRGRDSEEQWVRQEMDVLQPAVVLGSAVGSRRFQHIKQQILHGEEE